MKFNLYKAPRGSLEYQNKERIREKHNFSQKIELSKLIMIPIAFLVWLIIRSIEYFLKVDIGDHPEIIVLTTIGVTIIMAICSVIWTDHKDKIIGSIGNRKLAKQKAKLEKERYKDPWES